VLPFLSQVRVHSTRCFIRWKVEAAVSHASDRYSGADHKEVYSYVVSEMKSKKDFDYK
jgi:hypothetical protein